MSLRIGDLFSGSGQLGAAVEQLFQGSQIVWHSEVEPAACTVLERRFPGVPNLGDITRIDWGAVEPVDILCGGYPCQPFSTAGRRQGTNDDRHLWPYVVEALSELRPRIALFENVPGHLTLGFGDVMRDLSILRYNADWCVINASDVGAAHKRSRIFILASDANG